MTQLEQEFTEYMKKLYGCMGLDNITSSISAALFIEPDDISLEDLSKKTGYSLASVSNKVKLLQTWGLVQRIKKPKSKKVYIRFEKDIIHIQENKIIAADKVFVRPAKEHLPLLINRYKDKKLSEKEKKQMAIVVNMDRRIREFGDLMKKLLMDLKKLRLKNEK